MRKTLTSGTSVDAATLHASVVAVNAATIAFVDELLRLPSSSSAATVVHLLYGGEGEPLPTVLSHLNGGIHIPLAPLLASPTPLAAILPQRLRIGGGWRGAGQALKGARASARARYRDLQTAFVTSSRDGAVPEPAAALVRYTYAMEGRQWLWQDAAARVLHCVVGLNRAALGLLAAIARGDLGAAVAPSAAGLTVSEFDLPEPVLDLMAVALPAVAVPDWSRFATALDGSDAALRDDESIVRYQSLLAEILGRTTAHSETQA